jgi:hypothetical protein
MTNSLVRIGGVEGEDLGPCQRNLAGIAVKKKKRRRSLQDFAGFQPNYAGIRQGISGITVEVCRNHC